MRGVDAMLVGVKSWREKGRQEVYLLWSVEGRPWGTQGSQTNGACMQWPGESFPLTVVACEIISSQFVLLVFHHC